MLGAAKIAPKAIIDPAAKRNDCVIAAVACSNKERGAAFAQANNIPSIETDYDALISRGDIDIIYNALPPNRHADLTIAALEAGKAVLCEKPFAMNAEEAQTMIAASRRTGRPLVEAFHYRFHPAFYRALALLRNGAIGALQRIDAHFDTSIPYKKGELRHTAELGGGALMDLGCYPLHWARTIANAEPKVVSASAQTAEHQNIDVSMQAALEFPNGISATIGCSMKPNTHKRAEFTVIGEKGELHMSNPLQPSMGHLISITTDEQPNTETVSGGPTYEYQLAHMLAVTVQNETPITGGSDALANMTAIDAIYHAAGMQPRRA